MSRIYVVVPLLTVTVPRVTTDVSLSTLEGVGMLKSRKSRARHGHRGCFCCYGADSRRTLRTRENRAWKRDQSN